MGDIKDAQEVAWSIAEEKGFHSGDRSRAKVLALIHSEVSEALEADRNDRPKGDYAEELADIVIRVLDHAEEEDINLEQRIYAKMRQNEQREYKHGKEY